MKNSLNCKLCESTRISSFFHLPSVPTMDGVMESSETAALNIQKGTIDLHFCQDCGFIHNAAHEPEKMSFKEYDFSNDHSPLFKKFVSDLCDRLIEQYDLKGKTILDIGSGDGFFLKMICEKGDNQGIGIDPGFDHSNKMQPDGAKVTFLQEYYSEKHSSLKADFIVCRLVLTILEDQLEFVKMLRKNLEDQRETIVYFEVPNALYTFEDKIIWNVVYEHNTWYTKASITHLFETAGFEVLNVILCWRDEFLSIEARPTPMEVKAERSSSKDIQDLGRVIESFDESFQHLKEECNLQIQQIQHKGTKTIAWGAGARALTFFNIFDLRNEVPFIVDINPNRQGKYLPGSGQKIVNPKFMMAYQADLVIITNPTYATEIQTQIHEMGLSPKFWILSEQPVCA